MAENARATPVVSPAPGETPTVAEVPADEPKGFFLPKYRAFCYRLVGERIDRSEGNDALAGKLQQAGFNMTPGMHTSMLVVTTLIGVGAAFALSMVLFAVIIQPTNWWEFVFVITLVTGVSIPAGFRFTITERISNRKDQLDRELPFTLSELSVLASTGTAPIKLMRRMAQRGHDPAMTAQFKRVIYKTDIQGKDLITALAETAKESPSTAVREAFWDLANMIHQGGNLDEYLRLKADSVFQLKRVVQKEFIERLSTFLDMYVSLVLVGVLMIAVAAFLINAFGQTAAGLDANDLLLLLTFGLVPLAVVMTVIMISVAYARAE